MSQVGKRWAGWVLWGVLTGLGLLPTAGRAEPAAAAPEPSKPLELSYVPSEATAVLAFAPPAIHEPIRQALKAAQAAPEAEDKTAKLIRANLLAVLGAPSDAIEQITAVIMRPYILHPPEPHPHQNGFIIRTRQPHDFKRVASFFPPGAREKNHAGNVYYQGASERPRFYFFPDERTAIVANREADLHRFIDAGKAGGAQAGWAKAWKSVQSHHFAALVDLATLRQGGGEGGQPSVQPLVTALGPLGEKATTLVVGGTFDNGLALTANVTCATAEDGEKVRQTVEAWLAQGCAAIAPGRQTIATDARLPAEGKRLMRLVFDVAEGLLKQVQVQRSQETLQLQARIANDASVAFGSAWVLPALAQVRRTAR